MIARVAALRILPALALCLQACQAPCAAHTLPTQLGPLQRSEHRVGAALREPMLAEHPGGTLYAAGYSREPAESRDPPNLYRSLDGGEHWQAVDVGRFEDGAAGNSDVDLAIGPDGSLYFLSMSFDRSVGEGTGISIGVCRSGEARWTWTALSTSRFDDRPWIAIAPDGSAHVIWNDGEGVCHAVSRDAGLHWQEQARVHTSGGSSHLAVGPDGQLAVRITPLSASGARYDDGVDLVAISLDQGRSWQHSPAPGHRIWDPESTSPDAVPRWVEPLAWDAAGVLYSFWSEGLELWLARSADQGSSWQSELLGTATSLPRFPFLIADRAGELAASWFEADGELLRAQVALIDATGNQASLHAAPPVEVHSWWLAEGSRGADPGGEYFPLAFLDDGDLAAMLPVQNAPDGDGFSWLRWSRSTPRAGQ